MIILKLNLLRNRGLFIRSRQVLLVASYSRNSSNSKSPYKVLLEKIKNTSSKLVPHENGINWELFGPRNNRFFLASGSIGPAYMNSKSTLGAEGLKLKELVDFTNTDKKKLHISTLRCPLLLRRNLHEIFPAPEVIADNEKLTLITLSQAVVTSDHEKPAIDFVLSAREICARLRLHGYWADFLNPMSGKPFHSYHQKSLYKLNDERFRGLCMKLEEVKAFGANENCLLISEDKSRKFSGSVFSNIPANLELISDLIGDS